MKLVTPTSLFFFALPRWALSKNDWTKACLSGLCAFDIEEGLDTMGGTIEISGSPSAISDITPAAGWDILNCTDSTNDQTILIVCTDEGLGCNHFLQGNAEDTIVRLPQSCGSGPFVRIVDHWIPDLNSLSPDITTKLNESSAQVRALRIDDKFEQMSRRHGDVSFEIYAQGPLLAMTKRRKRQNGSGFENVTINLLGASEFSLFEDQSSCPSPNGGALQGIFEILNGGFDFSVNIASRGTMNPPSITSMNFSAPTTAHIRGFFILIAPLLGTNIINTVGMEVLNMALPSFLIDGIITINPSFVLTLDTVGLIQSEINLQELVDFEVDVNNLQFNYPTNSPPAIVDIDVMPAADNPFSVTLSPSENAILQYDATAAFQILVQVSAFTQFVDLSIFHNVGHNLDIATTPSDANNEEVCVNVTDTYTVTVSNSGPFFLAFEEAGSLQLFDGATTVVSSCRVVPLGPSPPISRFARSPLYGRDTVSCPPATAVSQNPISFLGSQVN